MAEVYSLIKGKIKENHAELDAQLEESLTSLANQINTMTAAQVQAKASEEVLELESGGEGKLNGWGYIDRIKELLDRSVAEYKEGNAQEAKSLATEAYLDNYEFIEADIAQENRELMEKIEIDMRVELVQIIDAGKPAAEVESHVNAIKTDLETARAVVTPEFPLAVVVLASVAATMLAGTLYTRRKGLASL